MTRRRFLAATLLAAATPRWALAADAYPSRPLKFVVNFPPGGAADTMARIFGQKLGETLKQTVIVENHAGAGGAVGMIYAARQAPDGYTFTMGTLGSAITQPLISQMAYDMNKDFMPVSLIATGPAVVVAGAASPYKTLQDLVAAARANPGKLNYGSGGIGTFAHLWGAMLNEAAGVKITHVPYKGGAQALNDVLANRLDLIAVDPPAALPHIRSGNLRALAYTGAQRNPHLADVPTVVEAGFKDLVGANCWSIWMPAGVPGPIAAQFRKALITSMDDPQVKKKFSDLGADAMHSTPDGLRQYVAAETEKYRRILAEQGMKAAI
ncbi:MAG TPA: tripartite tricarboxylate transporter substrate binding protein [Bordetella sp.]|nr:tripartite tricarboxylate transporter substrate binding protein [Bordetella sp.]